MLIGEISDRDLDDARTASRIVYPGSTCRSHMESPPPSPPPLVLSDAEAAKAEAADMRRQRDGNWEPCDEEDYM